MTVILASSMSLTPFQTRLNQFSTRESRFFSRFTAPGTLNSKEITVGPGFWYLDFDEMGREENNVINISSKRSNFEVSFLLSELLRLKGEVVQCRYWRVFENSRLLTRRGGEESCSCQRKR